MSSAAGASPGTMTVGEYLARATALKAQGFRALFSSEYGFLKQQGAAAQRAYTAQLAGERASGRPSSCPPRTVRVNSDVVLNHLRTYPASERDRVDIRRAVADYYQRTWPCRQPALAANLR
ncbi:MAG: hypothetical protein AB7F98_08825 [Novosphingobium sp.]